VAQSQVTANAMVKAAARLRDAVKALPFSPPVTHVYNPLDYAWAAHEQYIRKYATSRRRVLLLGMNPGPWGMAQTGVPFGEVTMVRQWLHIDAEIHKPEQEHPRRPILGLACERSEVSGQRLWGLFAQRYGNASRFFKDHFVANYCPLVFMEAGARNRTPDKLPVAERQRLEAACDAHLQAIVATLKPQWLVAVGTFAQQRAEAAMQAMNHGCRIIRILHPSPANPQANRDWAGIATRQLVEAGVWPSVSA